MQASDNRENTTKNHEAHPSLGKHAQTHQIHFHHEGASTMNQTQTQTPATFNLTFAKEGYIVRLEGVPGGYVVNCIDIREGQRIYRVLIVDLAELFWAVDEIEACIDVHEEQLAEMRAEHPPEVLRRAKALAQLGIKTPSRQPTLPDRCGRIKCSLGDASGVSQFFRPCE